MSKILNTAVLLLLTLSAAAWAQMLDSQPVASSKSFSRDFADGQVNTQFTLRAGGVFEPGQRALIQVDIDSSPGSAEVQACFINGFVVFALPPGLEADGQPRLLFYNEQLGRYDYMYSKAYPVLDRLAPADAAFADAGSNDPQRIRAGLVDISLALDSAVSIVEPHSPRLTGDDRSYSITGVSWLVPANVYMKELVSLFDPEPGLYSGAKLRAVLQVKVTGGLGSDPIEVYAGGLSAAMHQMELLPSQLPATAIPLVPLPDAGTTEAGSAGGETPPASEEPETPDATQETPPSRESTPIQQPPSRSHTSRQPGEPAPSAGQDEQPAGEAEPAAAPQPIPAMVYSYQWLAWETQYVPASSVPATDTTGTAPVNLEPATSGADSQFELPEDHAPVKLTPPAGSEAQLETQVEPSNPPQVERPVREPAVITPADSGNSSARQVAPGTLPTEPEEYTVPLKEIMGNYSGGSTSGQPEFRLKPAGGDGGGSPGVITPQLPAAGMNLPAPEGLDEMILIPAGPFLMGTATGQGGDADEQPQVEVNLPAYYIDKYPVTNRQFHNFVISAGYKPDGNWQKYYGQGTADLPVRGVSHADAEAFARWAGKRLPTEAEWEKAARGADGRTYPWGEDWSSEILPRGDETSMYSVMTAASAASPFGVMGMAGLVWQWTASPYAPYPFNPDARSDKYVLRGGAYSNGRGIIRCANRYYEPGNVALNTFGFRCVKDAR